MSKFSQLKSALAKGPTATDDEAISYNGGSGFATNEKTALYALAVTNMVSEVTFYESAIVRDERFAELVHKVTADDPAWVAGLALWLRTVAHMRSVSIVTAVEYVRAGGPNGRGVIASVCLRADEPAEVLGYWLNKFGKPLPMAVKRGVSDAAAKLYNEQSAIKWDSSRNVIRMGDVIDLVHPKPNDAKQSQLFHYLLDRRHKRDTIHVGELLTDLNAALQFDVVATDDRRAYLNTHGLPSLYTWERLSGWLPGGLDAEAWEHVIPNMGYMALLRNLRNFESAGVSEVALDTVKAKLADSEEVAKSKQLPYRFWAAYKATGSLKFADAIESALEASVSNVPKFSRRTLVAIDTSGSMQSPVSSRSEVLCVEVAAVFAAAVAKKSDVDLMIYASKSARTDVKPSVLRTVEHVNSLVGSVGHGTETWPSVLHEYNGQDRIIVFTDMQDNPASRYQLPNVPVYVWDLRGYSTANIEPGSGRYLLSGFNDASFSLVNLLEQGRNASWSWEA